MSSMMHAAIPMHDEAPAAISPWRRLGHGFGAFLGRLLGVQRRAKAGVEPEAISPHLRELDEQVYAQLLRAVNLSEQQSVGAISQATELHQLSSRLVTYLDAARVQSEAMQGGIEHNTHIITELASFVRQLPVQIAEERQHFGKLVSDIKQLQDLTDTIRRMARQTEILAINAAIEAARAGEAGKGFAVLAGEVRRLATESNAAAGRIENDIGVLVNRVEGGYSDEFQARARRNESESERLSAMTRQLDESYVDMRQFYQLLMTAVTQHNMELDKRIGGLLDAGQIHDVLKQIVDRVGPALQARQDLSEEALVACRSGTADASALATRAQQLVDDYVASEALHRDPDAQAGAQPGDPGLRIELF